MSDRKQRGHVDGERTYTRFMSADVEFPVALEVRDKATGREVTIEWTFAEARRALDTLAETIQSAFDSGRRGIPAPRPVGRRGSRAAGAPRA